MIPDQNHLGTAPAPDQGTGPVEHHPTSAPSPAGSIGPVIDLRDGPTTRVRVARHDNPFSLLSPPERMRLIIRVLCELVAYDELGSTEEQQRTIRAAMDATEAQAARPGPRSGTGRGPGAPTSITG